MKLRTLSAVAVSALAGLAVLTQVRDAQACGGCFHPPPRPNPPPNEVESVITDHRMVFSISQTQTVLWDQVRYSGDPTQFAWVLPVHPGATIELSHDAFIAALDASTQPLVTGPTPPSCPGTGFGYGGGTSSSVGCGSSSDSAASFSGGSVGGDASTTPTPGVTVVSQETVGPYEAVTVRASMGDALETWLTTNGFDVPASIQPTLSAYASEGFDFIALKLRPGQGVRAMQPVRIVTSGADPSLPLRMVAAGIGANVGFELYVISEGRYRTQNFPDAVVDFTKLTWDPLQARSNFSQLEEAALTSGDGRGWITQSAGPANLSPYGTNGANPGLYASYTSLCMPTFPPPPLPCDAAAPPSDAASDGASMGGDAASGDAGEGGASDAGVGDAGTPDAAAPDAAACPAPPKPQLCDDIDVATAGMTTNIWVTRLRARLPAQALAVGDLRLEAAPLQAVVDNVHHTDTYSDPNYKPCPSTPNAAPASSSSGGGCGCTTTNDGDRFGTWFLLLLTAMTTGSMLRKKRS